MRFCQESYPHKAKGRVSWWLITCVFQSYCYFESGDRKILFRAWDIHPYFCLFLRKSLPVYPRLSLNLIFPQHQHPECWSYRWGQVKQTIFKRQLGLHLDASIAHIKQWTEITNDFTPCGWLREVIDDCREALLRGTPRINSLCQLWLCLGVAMPQ